MDRAYDALPKFREAYDPDGLTVDGFDSCGSVVMTLDGFDVSGWQNSSHSNIYKI